MRLDVVGKSLGSHTHGIFVHPVRADSHNSAESSGSEFKIAVECILEAGRIGIPELKHLAFGLIVKIAVKPLLSSCFIVQCHCVKGFCDTQK